MKNYEVIVSIVAESSLRRSLDYICYVFKSPQTAENVLRDFNKTVADLSFLADTISEPMNEHIRKRGYKYTKLKKHNYYVLFRIENDKVIVDNLYQTLEDMENKIR